MTYTYFSNLFAYTWQHSLLFSLILPFMSGAAFGSFLNVLVLRAPFYDPWSERFRTSDTLSTIQGRSYCPHCASKIPLYHNIPVLSWLVLRGRSVCCKTPIKLQYLILEVLYGLLLLGLCYVIPAVIVIPLFLLLVSVGGTIMVRIKFNFMPRNLLAFTGLFALITGFVYFTIY